MADKYDDDIEFLTANPHLIPVAWNQGCYLFASRRGITDCGCPSQVKGGQHRVDVRWRAFIEECGIPEVNALRYVLEPSAAGYDHLSFPIQPQHLQGFAEAQRKADELGLGFQYRSLSSAEDETQSSRYRWLRTS
jgi:hypothetical protein